MYTEVQAAWDQSSLSVFAEDRKYFPLVIGSVEVDHQLLGSIFIIALGD